MTTTRLQTVRRLQTAMATVYSGLGAWCLFHPASVISLGFTPKYIALANETTDVLFRCFGAQAMTCGLLLGTSDMTPFSFTAFGLAMIPYIGWNYWCSGIGPGGGMINSMMWLDFCGNVFFMMGSLWCAKVLREEESRQVARSGDAARERKGL
ncbi:Integral membrane protein [Madurella fahalii]|uniref:Integral membrane protein n=1 Tax=Madurella fahalii TaxID=1157608 RepID=A0ABQ0GA93_9PEZI